MFHTKFFFLSGLVSFLILSPILANELRSNQFHLDADPTWLNSIYYKDNTCGKSSYTSGSRFRCTPEDDGQGNLNSNKISYVNATYYKSELFLNVLNCSGTAFYTEYIELPTTCKADGDEFTKSQYGSSYIGMTYNMLTYDTLASCKTGDQSAAINSYSFNEINISNTDDFCDTNTGLMVTGCIGSTLIYSQYTNLDCTGKVLKTINVESCNTNQTFATNTQFICPSPANDEDSENVCFSGNEVVELDNGNEIKISEVKIGHNILSSNFEGQISYSKVVAVVHSQNDIPSAFVHIETSSNDIKVTPGHLLFSSFDCSSSSKQLTKASSIQPGSCVFDKHNTPLKVTSISLVKGYGVYSVVTENEFIFVNGIEASPFGFNHHLASKYYNLHRFINSFFPFLFSSKLFTSFQSMTMMFADKMI